MSYRTNIMGALVIVVFILAVPGEAQAQGFWDWVHRMSGPEYPLSSAGARVGLCLNKDDDGRRCLTVGSGLFQPVPENAVDRLPASSQPGFVLGAGFLAGTPDPDVARGFDAGRAGIAQMPTRPILEVQLGFAGSYGWSGDNPERDIEAVRMLVLEPQVQVVMTALSPVAIVTSVGVAAHRFWHGTVPEPFWVWAPIVVAALRYEWGGTPESPTWYVQGGWKFRYFFNRIDTAKWGGTPEPGVPADGGEFVNGFTIGFGYRLTIGQ